MEPRKIRVANVAVPADDILRLMNWRHAQSAGFWRRHRAPTVYDARRLVATVYITLAIRTDVFKRARSYFLARYPAMKPTPAKFDAQGNVLVEASWWNEFTHVEADAVLLRTVDPAHPMLERRHRNGDEPTQYMFGSDADRRCIAQVAKGFFGSADWGQAMMHDLVWADPALRHVVAQGAAGVFDSSQFQGHGYSGGVRPWGPGGSFSWPLVLRDALWLLWSQERNWHPAMIADAWATGDDRDNIRIEWGKQRTPGVDTVRQRLRSTRRMLGVQRPPGRPLDWVSVW
jgi:hypothetical protein